MNPTIEKFRYPATLVREYEHWMVLLRPAQVTFGSLVLAAKSDATAYGHLPSAAFAEQGEIVAQIEQALGKLCAYDKINYLMLMMVDPNVHFHVIPRYSETREWAGLEFPDKGWPGAPALADSVPLDAALIARLREEITVNFC